MWSMRVESGFEPKVHVVVSGRIAKTPDFGPDAVLSSHEV